MSEHTEQAGLIAWCQLGTTLRDYPALKKIFAIPNGGRRDGRTGAMLQAEGVAAGVPDLCLPVARGPYHGLYIEMKDVDEGRVKPDQRKWLTWLEEEGYQTAVCRGWEAARKVLETYLSQPYSPRSNQ